MMKNHYKFRVNDKIIFKLYVIFIIIFGFNLNSFASCLNNICFVAQDGSDYNAGNSKSPFSTLTKALNTVNSGGKIIIEDGEYYYGNIEIQKNIKDLVITSNSISRPKLMLSDDKEYSFLIDDKSENITINNIEIVRTSKENGYVIGIGGNHCKILNCKIYYDELILSNKYDCIKILADDTLIDGCTIFNAPNQGIDSVGKQNIKISNNEIFNCSNAITIKGGSKQVVIEKNHLYNLRHGAIGLGGTTDTKWHNNNLSYYEIEDAVARNNIINYKYANNIGGGIYIQGGLNCIVHNNTVYGAGIHLKKGGSPIDPQKNCKNIRILNNIIWRTGNDGMLVLDKNCEAGVEINNNIFWKTTGSGEFKIFGIWYAQEYFISNFNFQINSTLKDPMFTNPGIDFRLNQDSPAIDAGINIQDQYHYGKNIDIGALETVTPVLNIIKSKK